LRNDGEIFGRLGVSDFSLCLPKTSSAGFAVEERIGS